MSNVGQAISKGLEFASKVGQECEALGLLLKQEISDLFRQPLLAEIYIPGEWSHSYQTDDNGWVYTGVAWSLALTPKYKEGVTTYLSFQIALLCDNSEGGMCSEPLLHINHWSDPVNFSGNCYMGFEMHGIAPACLALLGKGEARLFRWVDDEGGADQWTYSLRLADVRGLDDLRALIASPVEQLLIEPDADKEPFAQLDKVVVYSSVDDMPDYYRVVSN